MTYSSEHYYLQLSGVLSYEADIWSMGFRMSGGLATADRAGEEAVLANLAASLQTSWPATGCPVHGSGKLTMVKYNRIGLDGKYMRDYTNLHEYGTPVAGTKNTGATIHAPQVALVGTLETGAARGLAHRGRVYIPQPGLALGTGAALAAADVTAAANWLAALISGLNGVEGAGDVIVASGVRAGATRTVTGVSVGNVLDTMRSRRSAINEVRQSATVTQQTGGGGGAF